MFPQATTAPHTWTRVDTNLCLLLAEERGGPRPPEQLAEAILAVLLQQAALERPQPVSVVHLCRTGVEPELGAPLGATWSTANTTRHCVCQPSSGHLGHTREKTRSLHLLCLPFNRETHK
jgi:hypothetical protein